MSDETDRILLELVATGFLPNRAMMLLALTDLRSRGFLEGLRCDTITPEGRAELARLIGPTAEKSRAEERAAILEHIRKRLREIEREGENTPASISSMVELECLVEDIEARGGK